MKKKTFLHSNNMYVTLGVMMGVTGGALMASSLPQLAQNPAPASEFAYDNVMIDDSFTGDALMAQVMLPPGAIDIASHELLISPIQNRQGWFTLRGTVENKGTAAASGEFRLRFEEYPAELLKFVLAERSECRVQAFNVVYCPFTELGIGQFKTFTVLLNAPISTNTYRLFYNAVVPTGVTDVVPTNNGRTMLLTPTYKLEFPQAASSASASSASSSIALHRCIVDWSVRTASCQPCVPGQPGLDEGCMPLLSCQQTCHVDVASSTSSRSSSRSSVASNVYEGGYECFYGMCRLCFGGPNCRQGTIEQCRASCVSSASSRSVSGGGSTSFDANMRVELIPQVSGIVSINGISELWNPSSYPPGTTANMNFYIGAFKVYGDVPDGCVFLPQTTGNIVSCNLAMIHPNSVGVGFHLQAPGSACGTTVNLSAAVNYNPNGNTYSKFGRASAQVSC